jgi:hypothetical protein
MTPRALLTAIGATAIGFAIAIGGAAGFASGALTPSTTVTASADSAPEQTMRSVAYATPGTDLAHLMGTGVAHRLVSSENDCPIAL